MYKNQKIVYNNNMGNELASSVEQYLTPLHIEYLGTASTHKISGVRVYSANPDDYQWLVLTNENAWWLISDPNEQYMSYIRQRGRADYLKRLGYKFGWWNSYYSTPAGKAAAMRGAAIRRARMTDPSLFYKVARFFRIIQRPCSKCGVPYDPSFSTDHIIALCLGGEDKFMNYQHLCASCHKKKTREDARKFRHFRRSKWLQDIGDTMKKNLVQTQS